MFHQFFIPTRPGRYAVRKRNGTRKVLNIEALRKDLAAQESATSVQTISFAVRRSSKSAVLWHGGRFVMKGGRREERQEKCTGTRKPAASWADHGRDFEF